MINIKLCVSLLYVVRVIYGQPCPNDCSSRGRCINPGQVCECFDAFDGPDCSLYKCPVGPAWVDTATGVDQAHNLAICSNKGICNSFAGTCTCADGFEGNACQRMSCPSNCNSVGVCLSMNSYARTKDPGVGPVYVYNNVWNANMTHGCRCDTGFSGPDCSLRVCPTGDDPFTGRGLGPTDPVQFNTIQRVNCRGGSGTFTLSFRGETTKPIPWDSLSDAVVAALEALPTIGTGGVNVILYSVNTCSPSGQSYFQVEFLQDFGTIPLLVPDYSKLGDGALIVVSIFQAGSKEDQTCSGRGICDQTSGVCACLTDFDTSNGYGQGGTRGDCGWYTASTPLQTCPGIILCSGHGVCKGPPTYVCECSDGWTGADCSLRTCPSSISWFAYPTNDDEAHLYDLVECGNAGLCDRTTGVCGCNKNFEGAACEFMSCPGGNTPCQLQGQCLDMKTLASLATVNGELVKTVTTAGTVTGFDYGSIPDNPLTWDALRIKGCLCDKGFGGYDCSLYTCPYGDDPSTRGQLDEIQTLSCYYQDVATTATITLTFRDESSVALAPTATLLQVTSALSAVSTIGKVTVVATAGSSDTLCSTTNINQGLNITFLQAHGPLPLLRVSSSISNVFVLSVVEGVKGTKEHIECSGRGICNTLTGVCACFAGYGSSDGLGGPGQIGDCGNILHDTP